MNGCRCHDVGGRSDLHRRDGSARIAHDAASDTLLQVDRVTGEASQGLWKCV